MNKYCLILIFWAIMPSLSAQLIHLDVRENDDRSDVQIINDTMKHQHVLKDSILFDMLNRGGVVEIRRVIPAHDIVHAFEQSDHSDPIDLRYIAPFKGSALANNKKRRFKKRNIPRKRIKCYY